jgi:archaemetzincin
LLRQVCDFGSAFFMRDVRLLPAIAVAGNGVTERTNRYTGTTQLKTRDLLPLLVRRLPADACCMLGMTALDLYPDESWSFVFGEAMLDERVGVFSIARYDPRFYDKPADPTLLLKRACKVLAHETSHMLGIRHCIFFNCLMNGSNHLSESDRRPLDVCPIDLRKLHWSLAFDIVERCRRLVRFWRDAGVDDTAESIERRLAFIEAGDAPLP